MSGALVTASPADPRARGAPAAAALRAAAGRLGVRVHRAEEMPETLREAWQALAAEAAEPNAYAEPWFVGAGLHHFAASGEVRLIEVRNGAGLVGILPLAVERWHGRIPARHVENWRHHHDFLGTPLVRAGFEQPFWSAVLACLDAADWAPGFLHIDGLAENGPVHRGLAAAAAALGRNCPIVHGLTRAALGSTLSPEAYFEANVRKKKRKELKRLTNRLAEEGGLAVETLGGSDEVGPWCDAFLALERAGWKGRRGTALACEPATESFFREAIAGAQAAGRLDFLRLSVDGRPIAMLANFITPPGSFSFKIASDEEYARFSPGVLIELENLRVLRRDDVAWMDSCASEDHPMIDSLWGERRRIVRVSVPLSGFRRAWTYRLCRALEIVSARRRLIFGGVVAVAGAEQFL